MQRLFPLARLAFAAMLVTLPLRAHVVLAVRPVETVYQDYTNFLFFAPDAFMLAALALWAIAAAITRQRIQPGPSFIWLPMAGLTLVIIVTSFFSLTPAASFKHSLRILLLAALYLFVINEFKSFGWITVPLALQILIQAAVSIAQFYQQHSIGLQSLGEYELDPLWSGVSVVFANGTRVLRAYGLTDHPNLLGGCLAFAMILGAARFGEVRLRAKILTAIAFTLGAITLLLTFSRAAYGAFALGLTFIAVAFWRTRQTNLLKQFGLLLAIAAIFVLPVAWQNAASLGVRARGAASASQVSLEIRSLSERSALNQAANDIFSHRPLQGVGIGGLPEAIHLYYPNFEFYAQPAHFTLLDAAAETGIFGALFYLAMMISPWIALGTRQHSAAITWTPALIGTSAALLAITGVGFFDYYTWLLNPGRLWQWTAWGLWSAAYQSAPALPQVSKPA